MQNSREVSRRTWFVVAIAAILVIGLVVPALATTTWNPTHARFRYQDQPRAWDNHNTVAGVPNGGGTGGQFPENGQAFATGLRGTTHLRYAVWTADRISGNEQQPLVPYGGAGNPQAAKDCALASNAGALNPATARTITGASWAGGSSTFTTSGIAHRFFVGDQVVVSGVTPSGYNGTRTVTASGSGTSVTVSGPVADPGAYTSGGTITRAWNCSGAYFARAASDRSTTTISVTAASRSGSYITYTTASAHGLSAGDAFNVWGSNDNYEIASTVFDAPTTTTFRVCHSCVGYPPNPGTYSGGALLYKSTWVWDGGGAATGCATAICTQYGLDAYPISDMSKHTMTTSVAAAGQYVYVLYSTTNGYYTEMCQPDPRTMWVRVNTAYGDADAWLAPTQLSTTGGRVGYGAMGAGGTSDGYATWTDSNSGDIKVAVTHNGGGSWTTQGVANTRKLYDDETMPGSPACSGSPISSPNPPFNGSSPSIEGFDGAPNIQGNGAQVGLIWHTGTATQTTARVMAKISINNGDTWPGTNNGTGAFGKGCPNGGGLANANCSLILTNHGGGGWAPATCTTTTITGGGSAGTANCGVSNSGVDAISGRIGFLWADNTQNGAGAYSGPPGLYYREWSPTTGWTATRIAGCLAVSTEGGVTKCGGAGMAGSYYSAYSPSVALYGTTGVAYAASVCPVGDATCTKTHIIYRESGDKGSVWHDGCDETAGACGRYQVIANSQWATGGGTGLASEINDYPSVELDQSSGATAGCASSGTSAGGTTGLPATGCVRFVYFLGRDTGYYYYRMYTSTGVAS